MQPLTIVDAFTDRPFAGNPAAVCVLDEPADDAWMQLVAREMNLSETAFCWPEKTGTAPDFRLRWFTPTVEEDLCGHATLATAHVLWEEGRVPAGAEIRFATRSGTLVARRAGDGIELDFPATPVRPAEAPADLLAGLGVEARSVGRSCFDFLVEVADEAAVRAVRPDMRRLAALDSRGVIVTAPGTGGFDFVSRFFAPHDGVDEDPVTGSAHCALGPWWGERLGKHELRAFQASARGGIVGVRLAGDRVILVGQAVTVMRGELF